MPGFGFALRHTRGCMMSSKTTTLESLHEAVPDALTGVDHAGVIRGVNHLSEVLFGDDREDLVGAPIETLVPESLRKVHRMHREDYVAAPCTRTMGQRSEAVRQATGRHPLPRGHRLIAGRKRGWPPGDRGGARNTRPHEGVSGSPPL